MMDALVIRPVPPERQAEVLGLVLRHSPADDRAQQVEALLADARSGKLSLRGLLEARRGGRLVGGIFSELQVGRTAVVWPPRLVPNEPATTGGQLLAHLCRLLAEEGICVAHALLEGVTKEDEAVLQTAGFEPLAELLYLVSGQDDFPRLRPTSTLEFEPYSQANHDRLARLVEATYEGTLDCPQLNGVRKIEDILAGYRSTGVFAPSRWLLVRHGGRDVGCLLLADHPKEENWELVYMGLVPSARGNGWGKDITRYAQWLTGRAGRRRLVLAVDAANGPAIRMYTELGFRRWDRRRVLWRAFEPPKPT